MATLSMSATAPARVAPWLRRGVRAGYAAKGVIYLLIGTLAFRLALGDGGRLLDQQGALRTLLAQPFGSALVGMIGVGLVIYAAWEIIRALADKSHGWGARSLEILKGLIYGAIGVQGLRMVLGAGRPAANPDDYARDAMQLPMGEILLAVAGVGVAIYGITQIKQAWESRFDDDLDQHRLRREGGTWVINIGRSGIGARGVVLVLMGIALVRAGFTRQPANAQGIPEAFAWLWSQPYGALLLAAVAAGIACYGFFQLLHARYARV